MLELVDSRQIAQMLSLNHTYVRDRLVKAPTFPRPALSLSQKVRRWERGAVEQWLEQQRARAAR